MLVGKLVSISKMRVEILLNDSKLKLRDVVYVVSKGEEHCFEISSIQGNIATAIPFENVIGLSRGLDVYEKDGGLSIQ